jgi:hypothetical protein
MPDPHVETLYYRFRSLNDQDTFDKAAPLSGALGDFDFTLESQLLTARPRSHFGDRESARRALEPFLRSWELDALLSPSNHRIQFEYDHSDVIDRQPDGDNVVVYPDTIQVRAVAFDAVVRRDNGRYPEPDSTFIASPITERLAERLRRVRDKEAEVPATAYFVLTDLVGEYGGPKGRREVAAAALSVDPKILDTMGKLTDRRDPDLGRKAGRSPVPLTMDELGWLHAAMTALIRRTGEVTAGGSVRPLSMADLPGA